MLPIASRLHQTEVNRALTGMQPPADNLRDCAVDQIGTDRQNRAHPHHGNQERRHDGATAHSRQTDEQADQETGGDQGGIKGHSERATYQMRCR